VVAAIDPWGVKPSLTVGLLPRGYPRRLPPRGYRPEATAPRLPPRGYRPEATAQRLLDRAARLERLS
jgi:hypothetical protein